MTSSVPFRDTFWNVPFWAQLFRQLSAGVESDGPA